MRKSMKKECDHEYEPMKDEQGFTVYTASKRRCSNIYTIMKCKKCGKTYKYKGVHKASGKTLFEVL